MTIPKPTTMTADELRRLTAILQRAHAVADKSTRLANSDEVLDDERKVREALLDVADTLYAMEYWLRDIVFPSTLTRRMPPDEERLPGGA